MREFILYSRRGRTDGKFGSLRAGGRLDVVYQCLLFGLFVSGALRRDVVFHVVLGGPPRPPLCLTVDGRGLWDVRTDERTWEEIFRKVLSDGSHPGISVEKESLQELVKKRVDRNVFVLEEKGEDVWKMKFGEDPVFVLGDQVGLPKKDERYVLRFSRKISLGKRPYLSATCVDVINYLADLQNIL
ncbi:MAG: tRNA (pseudouridine(54)-N(1))-methyltransferase TrmY [Candidatus Bathyarchaeota archaeon]|nr:tRNA (pseudouridine(54)-N(1))-methyltransferase TrmY [Candidatus Bathyarchaeota archaeon]MDH5494271.1 tRNA (pseudouridine(54)-N(1))-methyltransferase TrmY [Candidatus Bathyarchaeota archaeon]